MHVDPGWPDLNLAKLPRSIPTSGPGQTGPQAARVRLSPADLFRPGHLTDDLAGRTARGGLTTLASQAMQFLLQAAGVVILARLLSPADYGLVGMVAVFIGLAQVFKDGGLATGTIQRDEISHEQISTVFWVNVGLLALVGLAVIAASPAIAAFYGHPELVPVTAVLGVAFILNGLSVQHDALLRRHMRFAAVAITQAVPLALSLCVSIALALAGWGYWALVAGTVVTAVVSTSLSFYLCPWLPGRMRRGTGARHLVRFGRDLTVFNAFNYLARNADNMLVGRFIGAASLGLYSRAYSLFALPMTQIRGPLGDVSMPALSSLKDQPERYLLYYRRFLGALAFATVPLSAYCALEGDFLIATLMGPKWAAAAPVFRILAAAGVIQTIASTRGLVLLSLGKSRRYLWLGVANSVAMVASFVIGLPFGIVGVAVAYAVANLVVLVPSLVYTFRGTPVTVRAFFTVLLEPVAYAVLSAALATGALWLLGRDGLLPHALALAVFFGTYALLAWRSAAFRGIWRAFASGLASAPPAAVAADAGGELL